MLFKRCLPHSRLFDNDNDDREKAWPMDSKHWGAESSSNILEICSHFHIVIIIFSNSA